MTEQWFEVGVPLPISGALTYSAPVQGASGLQEGMRVRVAVGRRRVVGIVVGVGSTPPEGFTAKPILEVLDTEPVLPKDLVELARFASDYYLTPIGPVLKSMLPARLEPWGDRRVQLTDRGALAPPRNEAQEQILNLLRQGERRRLSELRDQLTIIDLGTTLETMEQLGWIRIRSAETRQGSRYRSAVELSAGQPDELLERVGRSSAGRAIVEFLLRQKRPATFEEVCQAGDCTRAVPNRLIKLGVLRRYTEIRRLDLGDHRIQGREVEEKRLVLRPDQASALERVIPALTSRSYHSFLLAGMTGSGKTEVYLRAAEATLELQRGALILVPEIALVPALAEAAGRRFGDNLAVLHSGLGSSERRQEWEKVRSGQAKVVIGARSALFAPIVNLGLVVVDEEQDSSYKQDTAPRYNGRDLALVRASRAGAVALLASATPSLESRYNVEQGKLKLLRLTHRAGQGRLPDGILVDLRHEPVARQPGDVCFSAVLREEIERSLEAGEQIILLRNRRGYAPTLLCRACGEDHRCEDCGLPRTLHRGDAALVCHYCGSRRVVPNRCNTCREEETLEAVGAGTQRVEERFQEMYPGVPVAVLDRDTVQRRGGVAAVLDRFGRGDDQVLIGTQMVSKGHHFPRVGLAAVLSADSYLGFPDFRAVERTYNILTQLAGRAGRGDLPGRVVIQTYHPDHYAIRAALGHHDQQFADEELRFRQVFGYPPYSRLILFLVRDTNQERGWRRINKLAHRAAQHPGATEVRVLGPSPAPLERLKGQWRFQLILRGPSGTRLRRMAADLLREESPKDLAIDVDPLDLM